MANHDWLPLELADGLGIVLRDLLNALVGKDLRVGIRVCDGLRVIGPAWRERRVAPFFKEPEAMNPLRESPVASRREGSTEQNSMEASVTGNVLPACPQCHLMGEVIKSGKNRSGSQRFHCRTCQLYFTPRPSVRQPDQARKAEALALAEQGMSYRRIARQLGVHHQTVGTWISTHSAHGGGGN